MFLTTKTYDNKKHKNMFLNFNIKTLKTFSHLWFKANYGFYRFRYTVYYETWGLSISEATETRWLAPASGDDADCSL